MGLTEQQRARAEQLNKKSSEAILAKNFGLLEELQREEETYGEILPLFVHSTTNARAMMLHPQLIVDAKTVVAILDAAFPDNDKGK